MRYELVLGLIVAAVFSGALALGSLGAGGPETAVGGAGKGGPAGPAGAGAAGPAEQAAGDYSLTPEEEQAILFMREEEKLARDVYLTLYDMYGLQIFKNIAESEQNHMDAVLSLIEKYNLTDPAVDEVGVFTNETLQELYNTLIERASRSLADALLVGGFIEEKDIIDINKLINATDNPDIIRVFSNLVDGSARHLAAFAEEYERVTGQPYQPQLLTQDQYNAVIASIEKGGPGPHGGYAAGRR